MPEKKKTAFEKVQDNRKELVNKVIENMEKGYVWEAGWDINALRSQNPVSGAKYKGINRISLGYIITEKGYKDPRFITFKQAQDNNWKVKRGQNPVSGAKYKGINRISLGYIITEKGYKDPRFITFKQAQDNNWKVKRGEHGYLCEYWVWTKKEEKVNEKGEKEKVEVPLERPMVNYFTIFNMEQIEGNYPKFELPKLSHDEMLQVANDFIASSHCNIKETAQDRAYYSPSEDHIVLPLRDSFKSTEDFLETTLHEMAHSSHCNIKETAQDRAYYSPSEDHIVLPLRDSFKSTEDFLETTLHEMAHSTGKELGRKFGITPTEYAREELVAELSSMFIKADLGLQFGGKHFENHSAYLESWAGMLKKDPNELYRALVAELSSMFIKADLGLQFGGKHFENHSAYLESWAGMLKKDPNELYRASKEADKVAELLIDRYKEYLKTKENIVEKTEEEVQKEDNKEIINADKLNEYWRIEFNETDSTFGVKSYENQILTKELLDEIRELDKKMYDELGALKFYFEHIKDGEIIDKVRIDIGSNEKEDFKYLADELKKLEKDNNLTTKNDSLKGLELTLNFSEHNFGVPEGTKFKGIEAYNFLQKLIEHDKEQSKTEYID